MTRVFVRCDYSAPREKIIEKLTRAGFACTPLTGGATEEPRAGEEGAALLYIPKTGRGDWAEEALFLAESLRAGLVVVVRREDIPAAEQKLRGRGASIFAADTSPAVLAGALQAAAKAGERLAAAAQEIGRLRERLDCERIVGRAKVALVEKRGMTESEAHRYIEKTAMDERLPRRTVALRILGEL